MGKHDSDSSAQAPLLELFKPSKDIHKLTVLSFMKDPTERLEELRRNSLVTAEELPKASFGQLSMPTRDMPSTSMRTRVSNFQTADANLSGNPMTSEIAVDPVSSSVGQGEKEGQSRTSAAYVDALPMVDARAPQRGRGKLSTDTVGPFDEYSIA